VITALVIVCAALIWLSAWVMWAAHHRFQQAQSDRWHAMRLAETATIAMGLANDALALMNDGESEAAQAKLAEAYGHLRAEKTYDKHTRH
jgi:hypothetical protein